jgi:hypothetical protein
MGLNHLEGMTISEIGNKEKSPAAPQSLFHLMAEIAESDGGYTFSIRQSGVEIDEEIIPSLMPSSDDYSLWVRYGAKWHYLVIGAVCLDEIFFELVEAIQDGKADEIRICRPYCPQPRAL